MLHDGGGRFNLKADYYDLAGPGAGAAEYPAAAAAPAAVNGNNGAGQHDGDDGVMVLPAPDWYQRFSEAVPQSLDKVRVPALVVDFPVEALPEEWQRYVRAVSLAAGATAGRAFTGLAGAASAAVSALVDSSALPGLHGPIGLYTFDMGASGDRKSEMERHLVAPHRSADRAVSKALAAAQADWLERHKPKKGEDKDEVKPPDWIWLKHANIRLERDTMATILKLLEQRRSGYVLNYDAANWLRGGFTGSKGQLGNTVSSMANIFSTGAFQDGTTSTNGGHGHDYQVDSARLSLSLAMQVKNGLQFCHNEDVVTCGFMGRVLGTINDAPWAPAQRLTQEQRGEVDTALSMDSGWDRAFGKRVLVLRKVGDDEWIKTLLTVRVLSEQRRAPLDLASDAEDRWYAIYEGEAQLLKQRAADDAEDDYMSLWLKRRCEHILRLAALFAGWRVIEGALPGVVYIELDDINAAEAAVGFYEAEARRIAASGNTQVQDGMRAAVDMMAKILSGRRAAAGVKQSHWGPAMVGLGQVANMVPALKRDHDLRERVFKALKEEGHITTEHDETLRLSGNPTGSSRLYFLHPAHLPGAAGRGGR